MRRVSGILLSALLLTLIGCGGTTSPIELPDDAFVYDLFTANGTVYALHGDVEKEYAPFTRAVTGGTYVTYLTQEPFDGKACLRLPGSKENGALWHPGIERLCYGDGHGIYSCALNGGDSTLLWSYPGGTEKESAEVQAVLSDELLLIRVGFGEKAPEPDWQAYTYPGFQYYVLNTATGEAAEFLEEVRYQHTPVILCTYQNKVFLLQKIGDEPNRLLSVDLSTGQQTELAALDRNDRIYAANGFVLGETLYFAIPGERCLRSLPLSGGEIVRHDLFSSSADGALGEMTQVAAIGEAEGEVYILARDGASYPSYLLCRWNRESGALQTADREAEPLRGGEGFLISGENYYIFSRETVSERELA